MQTKRRVCQSRLRSWPLWTAIAALVVFAAKQFFGQDIAEPVGMLMDLLLPVLIGFGIINDPTNPKGL